MIVNVTSLIKGYTLVLMSTWVVDTVGLLILLERITFTEFGLDYQWALVGITGVSSFILVTIAIAYIFTIKSVEGRVCTRQYRDQWPTNLSDFYNSYTLPE